jgi:acetyltransferase-like isoleucine patch superfamily enzyme
MSDPTGGPPHTRPIRAASLPLWRIAEILWGIVRGAVFHRLAGFRRLPIVHGAVKVRAQRGVVRLGHLCEIHERVVLSAMGAEGDRALLSIGEFTSIWYGTVISAKHAITIGSHCAISWNCTIVDDDMHEMLGAEGGEDAPRDPAVHIGDHVWIGAAAMVLKGVTIGEDAVVAAGALVTRDVPPRTLVAGVPAKPVRTIAGWR